MKEGYSGVGILSKTKPIKVDVGLEDDDEGRVITAEFEGFFLVTAYVPNAGEVDFGFNENKTQNYFSCLLLRRTEIGHLGQADGVGSCAEETPEGSGREETSDSVRGSERGQARH